MNIEPIRPVLRRILSKKIYGVGAAALDFAAVIATEGLSTWQQLRECSRATINSRPIDIQLKKLSHPLTIRPGTAAASTVVSNIIRKEYGFIKPTLEPFWMVDAGAYIGDTSAYFLSQFPNLRVIALEPNPINYVAMLQNLSPYGDRAILLNKGLFSQDKGLRFSGSGTAGTVGDIGGSSVECVSIPSILETYSVSNLDILKMDIEGVEDEIFSSDPGKWLPLVGMIIVEIHSPEKLVVIRKILGQYHFTMTRYRSVWYCLNSANGNLSY